jgi:hypothetical protein
MNFTTFVQSHLKDYRKGLLGAALLLAFLVSSSTSTQAQVFSTGTGSGSNFTPTKGTTLTSPPKAAPAAINSLQSAINDLRTSFPLQTGLNEAIWDIKISYFEAVRIGIKDLNKSAATAIFEEVDRTLKPTAGRYVGIGNATLQSIVEEAVTLTH